MRRIGGQAVRHLLGGVIAVLVLAGLGIAALGWALNAHPVAAPWLTARIQQEVDQALGPGTLRIGSAALRWNGFHGGLGNPLVVELRDVVLRPSGLSGAEAKEIAVQLEVWPLLHGLLRPLSMRAEEVHVALPGLPATGNPLSLADPRAFLDAHWLAHAPPWVQSLRFLGLTHADLRVGKSGAPVLSHIDAQVNREADGQIEVAAGFEGRPADLADALPELGAAARLRALVSAQAGAALSGEGLPLSAHVRALAQPGSVSLTETPVGFLGGTASAAWSRSGGLAGAMVLAVQPRQDAPATHVRVEAAMPPGAGPITLRGKLDVDQLQLADLDILWPHGLSRDARRWTVRNLTAGTGHDGHLDYALSVAPDGSAVKVTHLLGSVSGSDLTVHWLRPVPPMEHGEATLNVLDRDRLQIALNGGLEAVPGVPDSLRLEGGSVLISGLGQHNQVAAIQIHGSGSVPAALALLSVPRLHLLADHPAGLKDPRGEVVADVSVTLPLLARVKIDQMEVKAAARVTHFALADLVAGRSLSDASVQMTADVNGMSFSGSGALADIPGHFSGTMDFRPGPPGGIVQRIVARTRTGIASLAGLGLDAAGLASGDVGLTALYQRRRDKTAWVDLRAELGATVLRLGVLGWRKPAGTPGAATARLVLDKAGRLAAIDDIDASGAGFAVRGEARLGAGGAAWIGLERVVLGNSQARGALAIGPGGKGVRVSLSGPVIDLGEWFQGEGRLGSSAAGSGAWVINARFARALLAQGRPLFNVALQASGVGATPRGLSLHAETAPARPVQVRLIPERTGRALFVSAADGGAVLRDLGVLGDIESGKLHVEGRFEDDRAGHPLRGIAELDEFRLRGAPLLGKALQAASLYGLLQALDGPGMNFNHLVAPFAYAQGIITLARARAFNPSLGLTAEGQIDLNAARLRLEGTIVPAYYLNTLPGRLPLIGPLFSPEKGGGLIAVRYVASGPLADPAISVNPLAALTPGLLRGLFGR